MSLPLSHPASAGSPVAAGRAPALRLNGQEKAAIIVRLLLAEGAGVPILALSEDHQAQLTDQIGRMGLVDRATLNAVAAEFAECLGSVGLAFPQGIEGALSMMDRHISVDAASRLRRMAGIADRSDPWDIVAAQDADALLPLLVEESVEVGAVMLSKLPVARAAELLSRLPGERARRIAVAVGRTGDIAPDIVLRIGRALAAQLGTRPASAFAAGPVERVGAILNSAPTATRDDVLTGLDAEDTAFAQRVRKTIFTFAHIAERVEPRDVAKVVRAVPQPVLVTALAGAGPREAPSVDFLLSNMSQRLAASLRDEMEALGRVREKDAEVAMTAVTTAIRDLEATGELSFVVQEEDEAAAA